MSKKLSEKLEIVKNEHAEQIWQEGVNNVASDLRDSFLLRLGKIGLANELTSRLQSQMIRELQDLRENNGYESFGFTRFDTFLNEYKFSPMNYKKFNRLENLFKTEGDVLFDLYNTLGLPQTTRKLLSNGNEIAIDGNELVIGDSRSDLSDLPMVKQIITEFVTEKNKLIAEKTATQTKLEKAESVINQGQRDYKELQRTIDAQNEGTAYDRSLSRLISSFIQFNDQVDLLPLVGKVDKNSALKTIWLLLEESRSRFGGNINLLDTTATAKVSDKAKKVFADDDDFGDED